MEKRCTKCHRLLPLSEFYKDGAAKDGRKSRCRICVGSDLNKRRGLYYTVNKLIADGEYNGAQWDAIVAYYAPDGRCPVCQKKCELTLDHVIPIRQGGSNWPDNLQPLCLSCNSEKHDKIIDYRPDGGSFACSLRDVPDSALFCIQLPLPCPT